MLGAWDVDVDVEMVCTQQASCPVSRRNLCKQRLLIYVEICSCWLDMAQMPHRWALKLLVHTRSQMQYLHATSG